MSDKEETARRIEEILRRELQPIHFELDDESARHVGHPGATSGGGHYRAVIVSARFEGLSLLEQHRLVNDALAELFGERIHALALQTVAPSSWHGDAG